MKTLKNTILIFKEYLFAFFLTIIYSKIQLTHTYITYYIGFSDFLMLTFYDLKEDH